MLKYSQWLNESQSGTFYRLIGGGQFGGSPVTSQNEPRVGAIVSGVFATPRKDSIVAMIGFCIDQGEDEETGNSIKIEGMRVLTIEASSSRNPRPGEKFMDWEESDKDEVVIEAGKITKVEKAKDWI